MLRQNTRCEHCACTPIKLTRHNKKFMNVIRCSSVALLSTLALLSGCSSLWGDKGMFRAREKDYVHAGDIQPITLPAGMESAPLDPLHIIPPINSKDEFGDAVDLSEYRVPRPVPLANEDDAVGVKIQKLGGERWIFLNASTAQVWPQTQSFLSEYNVLPLKSVPEKGLIESDWVHFRDDTSTKSRYRILIEKGIHPDTTEIHVLHAQFPVDANIALDESFVWPEQSSSSEREAWLMDELAMVLAESVDNSAASLMGQNVGGNTKAQYARVNGEPVVTLRLPYARAWASVSHATEADGFVEYETNSDLGLVYIGFPYFADDKPGFWGSLAFWGEDKRAPETSRYALTEILAHLSDSKDARAAFASVPGAAFGKELPQAQGYLVALEQKDGLVIVRIRDHRGARLAPEEAKNILRVLRNRLI